MMARILLADDDPLVHKTLREVLASAGHDVMDASNGIEAVSLALAHDFDVIVADVIMPGKAGLEVIAEIKAAKPGARIVAISGGGRIRNLEVLKIARRIGAVLVLAKPFTPNELIETVDRALALPGATLTD